MRGLADSNFILTTDVITIDADCEGIYYEAFYRHVESNRGTSIIFETVSSLLGHR